MKNRLHARRLNHKLSEIWLEGDSRKRVICTHSIYWAVSKNCGKSELEAFCTSLRYSKGNVAEVRAEPALVSELGLSS